MKKLITVIAVIAFFATQTTNVAAQEDMKMKEKETVKMKDGKMMVKKGLKWEDMGKDIKMSDGTQIMTNGTIVMKDGMRKTMKEGEEMSFGHKKMKNSKKTTEEKVMKDEKPVSK